MSTVLPIARSVLTGVLVEHLRTHLGPKNIYVGRGTAPRQGGWSGGQPGSGQFVAYVTVKTMPATSPVESNTLGRNRMSWSCSYVLTSSGALEHHADDVADWVREFVVQLPGPIELRGVNWTLQQVLTPRLGATTRNDSTDPPFWDVSDDVSLHLSRDRGA